MADGVQARTGVERRARLWAARLYLVVESRVDGGRAESLVEAALAGGVDIVQLRDKDATDEELVATGRRLGALCAAAGSLLIVNDRPDLALACGADGVHVGQEDEHPDAVRRSVGDKLLIGVSAHSPEQIAAAGRSAADYLGVGPVYPTATKPDVEPVGLELVRYAAAHGDKPFFAIGGIDPQRADEVAAAGVERIAVVRAIRDAGDPLAAARALRDALERKSVGGAAR